jgi:hypothetical protein
VVEVNAKTNDEKQRDYYERMKAAGMKKVSVYVPADKVAELRAFAAKLRDA